MFENTNIERFVKAQESPFCGYDVALSEIRAGEKVSHWIWYIFPQLRGLGRSANAHYYGLADGAEAQRYLNHPILGVRLREICQALLLHTDKSAFEILGGIDAKKLCSSMTLFNEISPNDIFEQVLIRFYNGKADRLTLEKLR